MSAFSLPVDTLCNVQLAIRLKQTSEGLVFGFETVPSNINSSSSTELGEKADTSFAINFQAEQVDGCPMLRISASPSARDACFSSGSSSPADSNASVNSQQCNALFPPTNGELLLPAETLSYESGLKPELTASSASWSYDFLPKSSSLESFGVPNSIYCVDSWNSGSEEYSFDGMAAFDAGISYDTSSAPTLTDMVFSNEFSPAISPSVLSSSSESPSPRSSSPASTCQWSSTSSRPSRPSLSRSSSSSSQSSRDGSPASEADSYNRRRKIPCTIPGCASRFTSQYTLKVHLEAHKPKLRTFFPCTLGCSERFSRQHDRLRHEVAKHGKVCEWVCSDCRRFFSSSRTLRNHRCPVAMAEGKTRWVT